MDHTFLYSIAGLAFYEDAKHGDTEAILVKINGEFYPTGFFDRPTIEDATALAEVAQELAANQQTLTKLRQHIKARYRRSGVGQIPKIWR